METVLTNNLLKSYQTIRQRTVDFCAPLQTEDYVPQPVPFASPPKWHLAHVSWFFEEMILKKYKEGYQPFHKDFGFLFNSYYQTVGERTFRAHRGNITRPGVDEVYRYRTYVDQHMQSLLEGELNAELRALVILGLNHEQQHQELLITDLKYALGHNPIFPIYDENTNLTKDKNQQRDWIKFLEGVYEIGHHGTDFCFDNELGRHKVYIHDFEISRALVTNGEYLKFIEAGGYTDFRYWLDEGWSWVKEQQIDSPLYWHKIDGQWFYYTLAGLQAVEPDAILAHISFYEANAYARWKGARLATEFEWEAVADQLDWGTRWEWTNSAYLPYPGFEIAEGAVGEYNGKFMINQMVLRGASVATSPKHSRKTYRNFFHPHFRWQYTGIRLAKTI